MIAARQVTERTLQLGLDDVSVMYTVHDINGNEFFPNSTTTVNGNEVHYDYMLPRGESGLEFTELNFTNSLASTNGGMAWADTFGANYHTIAVANRPANNLGAQGPHNGMYSYQSATPLQGLSYQAHPNFIRMNDITMLRGMRIAMRIDNTSEFQAARAAMTDFNGFNFQVNLKPIYNAVSYTHLTLPTICSV